MSRVVNGSATISPMKPSNAPHTESERSKMAGLSPIAFPMIFGVTIMSHIICTTMNTKTANPKIIQKFCPVSAALSMASNAVGINANVCRYGTRSRMPIKMPKPIAIGNPMMVNPMQKRIPIHRATSPWPRI